MVLPAQAALPSSLGASPLGAVLALMLGFVLAGRAGAAAVAEPTRGEQRLNEIERSIVRACEAQTEPALGLLQRVVDVNSGTLNFAGVRQVGSMFARELAALGFATRWADGAAFERAGHLIATRAGQAPAGKRLLHVLLIGHLDTVFDPDHPFQRFERLPGGDKVRGPGVTDMKGGDVILVHALAALRTAGVLDRLDVTVVMSGDEEDSGTPLSLARADLIGAARDADVAIGFEDGDGIAEHAVVARRGAVDWQLRTTGIPSHSSQVFQPEIGAGAAYEAARILNGFYETLAGEQYLTFNPGLLLGGTSVELDPGLVRGSAAGKTNVVAKEMVVRGDLRTLSPEQLASAQERMRAVVEGHLPGTGAELHFDEGYPPMAPTAGNLELLAILDEASRDLGLPPVTAVDPRRAGAADISFVAGIVPRAIDALGAKGTGGHTADETMELDSFGPQIERAALLLYRLAVRHEASR